MSLRNKDEAAKYLSHNVAELDYVEFMLALKDVISAQTSMSKVAQGIGVERANLHKILTGKVSTSFKMLKKILDHLELQVAIVPK